MWEVSPTSNKLLLAVMYILVEKYIYMCLQSEQIKLFITTFKFTNDDPEDEDVYNLR
jgi:hypothetical protein